MFDLRLGDCRDVMRTLDAESVDSIVTDPPYGLSFMGKGWDHGVPGVEFWVEALRVAKPGAHLLAFGGTRTFHRLAVAIEDAGWEIRDCVMWVYGSGFPKSHDVSKAIDKATGAERVNIGRGKGRTEALAQPNGGSLHSDDSYQWPGEYDITAPATDAARQWQGWGTALKPAWEPVIVARKPLVGTVAENVLRYGTGAINVDGCRVAGKVPQVTRSASSFLARHDGRLSEVNPSARWPANVIHDGSDEVVGLFPNTTSGKPTGTRNAQTGFSTGITPGKMPLTGFGDSGSAARFFYCAKANKADRDEGCEHLNASNDTELGNGLSRICSKCGAKQLKPCDCGASWILPALLNHHPTVKPTDLMRYLCRLVTPPNGLILDPFMGSGSTGKAAILEHYRFIGIDLDPEYHQIATARIQHAQDQTAPLFTDRPS